MARWQYCNILHVGTDAYRLWQFDARGDGFALNREHSGAAGEPLPLRTRATLPLLMKNPSVIVPPKLPLPLAMLVVVPAMVSVEVLPLDQLPIISLAAGRPL